MDRREFLKRTGGALAGALSNTLPSLARASDEPTYLESALTPKELEQHKTRSAEALVADVWSDEQMRAFALSHFFHDAQTPEAAQEKLKHSSTMAIPSATELQELQQRSVYAERGRNTSALDELAFQIPEGKYGLYVDGDTQKLYLLGNRTGTLEFVASFLTSTSAKEWSNKPDSYGTPLGLHRIVHHRAGKLGQILSRTMELEGHFPKVTVEVGGEARQEYFVRTLNHAIDPAVIITDAFALWGPTTPLERGVFLHGTNHEDTLGARYSGGCVRMANVDVHLLTGTDERGVPFVEVGALDKSGKSGRGGTPVMIHVSPGEKSGRPASSKPAWDANPPREASQQDRLPPGFKDVTGE